MARILLGVSGGIAAYKALELVRLATRPGHAVRVVQTPTAQRFVGAASFAALTGAPVLTDEFERDPRAARSPTSRRRTTTRSATSSSSATPTPTSIAPASANTIAKLAHGLADNLLTSAALAATLPVLVAPGDERPHVGAPGHAGQPRRCCASAASPSSSPASGALASKGEWGVGPPGRAGRAAGRRRGASCRRGAAARGTACACSSPPAARASRSTPCATSATARRGRMGFALADEAAALRRRGHRGRRQRRARRATPASRYVEVETAAELRGRLRGRAFAALRRAADGRRRRRLPARRPPRRASSRRTGRDALDARARGARRTCSAGLAAAPPARARRSSASPPSTARRAVAYGRDKLDAQGARRGRRQRRLAARASASTRTDNEVTIVTAAGERHVPRAAKAEVARGDPRRGRRPALARPRRRRSG